MITQVEINSTLKLFEATRARTESLCRPLKLEDYIPQPVEFASPPKWHLAHTSWFFEEFILKPLSPEYVSYNSSFNLLFNSYYQNMGEPMSRTSRGSITRPGVDEVMAYRRHISFKVKEILETRPGREVENLILIGCQHEQQHQELLLTDLKHTLGLNPIHPIYERSKDLTISSATETGRHVISEGVYEIGHSGDGFCFDNELNRHKVYVQEAEIFRSLVTNREFLEFMDDGGYERFNLWLDEGWTWRQENNIRHPLYWKSTDGGWKHFTLAGLKDLDLDSSVCHVSYYEAKAFAEWKGFRLPTEAEWEVASPHIPWGQRWEWTQSAYQAYPGFKTAEGALGEYNGKFMINQMVFRGSSPATSPGHSRPTYRNFFHPHLQWQYSGIRLAK